MQHLGLIKPVIKIISPKIPIAQASSSFDWIKPMTINNKPRDHRRTLLNHMAILFSLVSVFFVTMLNHLLKPAAHFLCIDQPFFSQNFLTVFIYNKSRKPANTQFAADIGLIAPVYFYQYKAVSMSGSQRIYNV